MTAHELARVLLAGPDLSVHIFVGEFNIASEVEQAVTTLVEQGKAINPKAPEVLRVFDREDAEERIDPATSRRVVLLVDDGSCPACLDTGHGADAFCPAEPLGPPKAGTTFLVWSGSAECDHDPRRAHHGGSDHRYNCDKCGALMMLTSATVPDIARANARIWRKP